MSSIGGVKIEDLQGAMRRYAHANAKKADGDGDKVLSGAEAARLPKDLRDNFAASVFAQPNGSVKSSDFVRELQVGLGAWARASDNGDGFLTTAEAAKLPRVYADNYQRFAAAQQRKDTAAGHYVTRDVTPPALIAAHERAFGKGPVSYADALKKAIHAVATDEYGLRYFAQQWGGPDGQALTDPKQIDAEVGRMLRTGKVELLPLNGETPTGDRSKEAWIFSFRTDGQGDHGVWGVVDRKSGDVQVTTYN